MECSVCWCVVSSAWGTTLLCLMITSQIARFVGPTWGPSGAGRTQVGPILVPWTLLSGLGLLCPHIDGLVQDCSNSSALAMEILRCCTKPSISFISVKMVPSTKIFFSFMSEMWIIITSKSIKNIMQSWVDIVGQIMIEWETFWASFLSEPTSFATPCGVTMHRGWRKSVILEIM